MKLVLTDRFELRANPYRFLDDRQHSSYATLRATDPGIAGVVHALVSERRGHPLADQFLRENPHP